MVLLTNRFERFHPSIRFLRLKGSLACRFSRPSLTEEAGGRERGAGGKEFMPLRKATWFQAPGFIHGKDRLICVEIRSTRHKASLFQAPAFKYGVSPLLPSPCPLPLADVVFSGVVFHQQAAVASALGSTASATTALMVDPVEGQLLRHCVGLIRFLLCQSDHTPLV